MDRWMGWEEVKQEKRMDIRTIPRTSLGAAVGGQARARSRKGEDRPEPQPACSHVSV